MAKQRQFAPFFPLYKYMLMVCSVHSSSVTSFYWQILELSKLINLSLEFAFNLV